MIMKPKRYVKMPVNNRFLDLFWQLAESEDTIRNEATVKMITMLRTKQQMEDTPCKELEYAIKRLIKGLASGRKLARVGFATTLCQLLRTFPMVTTTTILHTMKGELQVTSHEQKSDISNIILGRVMGYLALLQAGTLLQSTSNEVGQVVKLLMLTRSKKVPIHQLCVQALCQIAILMPGELFTSGVWLHLETELSSGWDGCSPDTLLLLLTVNKHHPSLVGKEFLAKFWNAKKIMAEKNFESIKDVMKQSTVDHPLIHNVCPELVKKAMKNPELFSKFWTLVISDKLMTQKMERRYLGFQLVVVALQNASSTHQVKIILTDTIVQAIVANLSHKDRPLHASVKKLCEDLVVFVGMCGVSDIQLTIIVSLICHPGTVLFDAITNSKYVHNLITQLTAEGYIKWTQLMMDLIRGKTKTHFGDFSNQTYDDLVQLALAELTRSITAPVLVKHTDWQLTLLQFLCLHAFFHVIEDVPHIPMCEVRVGEQFSERARTNIQGALYKALDRIATYRLPGEQAGRDLGPYIDKVYQVTQYVQSLMTSGGKVVMHVKLTSDVMDEWTKVMAAVSETRSKNTKDSTMSEGRAFELLFVLLGLQLFSHPKEALSVLEDLHVCYTKAFNKKRRMSMKAGAEPEWVEVITEVLLTLLSQGSHLVRIVTNTVFRMLSPHMTRPALQLVLNVLKDEEEGPLCFEDGESEDNSSDEESKDSGVDEESQSSGDERGDSEQDEQVDEALRTSLRRALGTAVADSEDDEHEDDAGSDLDDAAMFQLDEALSAVFRNMVKNKKNSKEEKDRKQQIKNFKLKCLDLLNGFVTSEPSPSLALDLLFPLLALMNKGSQEKALADVGKKATNVFNKLVLAKPLLSDPLLDKEALPDVIQKLISVSAQAHSVPLVLSVASACLFVIRILLGLETNNGPSPVRTRSRSVLKDSSPKDAEKNAKYEKVQSIIRESLRSFCLNRDTHLNHMLFHSMFERQASILWPQVDQMFELMQNEEVRVFCRTQVCGMLAVMINKETLQGIGNEAWEEFSKQLIQRLPDMLMKLKLEDLKPRFVHELLYLTLRVASTSQHMVSQLLTPEVISAVEELKKTVKKDTKAVCKRIVLLTQMSKKRKNQQPKKDVSAQKRIKTNAGDCEANGVNRGAAGPVQSDTPHDLCNTPRKNLQLELEGHRTEQSKSANNKRKRKSLLKFEAEQFTNIKMKKASECADGDAGMTGNTASPQLTPPPQHPDQVPATAKVNRRQSTRLSLMATPKGTPK